MSFSKTQFVVGLLVVTVVAAGVGTGVAYITLEPNPLAPGSGTLSGSNELSLQSQELHYTGTNVTAVEVTINNSNSSYTHTVDIHVALRNTSQGTVVAEAKKLDVTVGADGAYSFNVTLDEEVPVNDFDQLQVNVEQTD